MDGRRIAVLIAKAGLDGHDRGAIALTKALNECGFLARYSGLRRSPDDIAAMALRDHIDCVGLSSLSGAHLTVFPAVTEALRRAGWSGLVIAGGVIPAADEPALRAAGIRAVFRPHDTIPSIAAYIREHASVETSRIAARNDEERPAQAARRAF